MTCGIYCIEHIESGMKYIGKSKSVETRITAHKRALNIKEYPKDTNRYLWCAAQKYGVCAFKFWVVEELPIDDKILSERELHWMDFYDTCNRDKGYNLRRDSSSGMEVHPETRLKQSLAQKGRKHSEETKKKQSDAWDDHRRKQKSEYLKSVRLTKEFIDKRIDGSSKYCYIQRNKDGSIANVFDKISDVASAGFSKICVFNVCYRFSKTHKGFVWDKMLREDWRRLTFDGIVPTSEELESR